jgi:hypothetical protein
MARPRKRNRERYSLAGVWQERDGGGGGRWGSAMQMARIAPMSSFEKRPKKNRRRGKEGWVGGG